LLEFLGTPKLDDVKPVNSGAELEAFPEAVVPLPPLPDFWNEF
jgi:hypothetical protein